ncbi:MAG: hypothetical protein U0793_09830 [Gemmataceae bacterium]
MARTRPLYLVVCLALAAPLPLSAQPRSGRFDDDRFRYKPVPFDGKDIEALFKNQLEHARDLDLARKLLEQFKSSKIALPAKLDINDPALAERLKPILKGLDVKKSLKDLSLDELKGLKERLEKLLPENAHVPGADSGDAKVGAAPGEPSALSIPEGEAAPDSWLTQDGLVKKLKDWIEDLDQTEVGRWLKESPGWQDALAELHGQIAKGGSLDLPDFSFLEKGWSGLSSLPRPSLPTLRLPRIQLRGFAPPSFGPPGAADLSKLLTAALWTALAAFVLAVAYQIARRWRKRTPTAAVGLGPWPVNPAAVATRAELRLAFDYLALLTLGPPARFWNHRRIARALEKTATAAGADAVQGLAALYEEARYTDGPEALTPEQSARARASLVQLAGP